MKGMVTVGLFTYQRPLYLQRQLNFFKDLGFDFRIIILDGSESQSFRDQNKTIASMYKLEYCDTVDYKARHVLFLEKLDTEFGAWCTDDDLIVPSFYNAGAHFLKENKNYSIVSGKIYTLHYKPSETQKGYYLRNYLGNMYDFFRGDFVERIVRKDQAYAFGCPPTYYGVRRYDNIKLFCKYVNSLHLLSSMERLENICNLLHDGMKAIDVLMGFRDYSSETIRQPHRDDPDTYISKEDILVLQDVIRKELKDEVKSAEMLEYFASYAWPLPIRPVQCERPNDWLNWKLRLESYANLHLAHRFYAFHRPVTNALRKNIIKYSQ